jgi:flagellin-specific chaperone FliS
MPSALINLKAQGNDRKKRPDHILVLYRGAERFLTEAQAAMANKSFDMAQNRCYGARAIFIELMGDPHATGDDEYALKLRELYALILGKITEAILVKDAKILGSLVGIVAKLKSGREQVGE